MRHQGSLNAIRNIGSGCGTPGKLSTSPECRSVFAQAFSALSSPDREIRQRGGNAATRQTVASSATEINAKLCDFSLCPS